MSSIPLPALNVNPSPQQPSPLEQYSRLLSIKNAMQEQQLRQQLAPLQVQQAQQETQQKQLQLNDQQAMTNAMQQWDGKDVEELPGLVLKHGGSATAVFGLKNQIIQQKKNLADADEATLNNQAKINDLVAGHLETVEGAPDKQQAYAAAVNDLQQRGLIKPGALPPQYPGDDALALFKKSFMGQKQIFDQAQEERKTKAQESEAATKATEATTSANRLKAELPGGPLNRVTQDIAVATNPDIQANKEKVAAIEGQTRLNQQASLLQGDAITQAAQRYLETGQMPQGMRSPGMSAAIINRAGQLGGDQNIAANSASFKANQQSLESLQKNFDQVNAFENTAGKNLDQFLSTAQKVVDTGSPWINKPLRSVAAGGLGSADQAAFNAARQTALTEIAKVLSSSNASGVLSDSARGEVSQLIGPDASLHQIYSAAKILKQDMGNRHDAYQAQINDIKGRLGSATPAQAQQPQQTNKPSLSIGQKVPLKNGKTVTVTAVHPDGSFDAN